MSDTPLRIQRRRTRGWRMPPHTVSVTRPGPWGNPIDWMIVGRAAAVDLFAAWLSGTLLEAETTSLGMDPDTWPEAALTREWMLADLYTLRGLNLACWCPLCPTHAAGKPLGVQCDACAPCHADVLGQIANAPLRCEAVDA